jgi:magnesium transporter
MRPRASRTARAEHAAVHLSERIARLGPEERAGTTLERIHRGEIEVEDGMFVVGPDGGPLGQVPLPALLRSAPETRLDALMTALLPRIHAGEDQERAAHVAIHHGLASVPVVDDAGRLLGVVPPGALHQILYQEHIEDLHRLAGIRREERHARLVLEEPPVRRLRDRLPWLLVGLLGSVAATFLVSLFEATLQARVAVAFFVPGIVYLADAIGTQTEAIAVRGLSLSRVPLRTLLVQELGTGAGIGAVLGAIALPAVALIFRDTGLALAVALAVTCAGAAATSIGLLLPAALARLGRDPAFGSGPLATVIQDVLSLAIYLCLAWLLVS